MENLIPSAAAHDNHKSHLCQCIQTGFVTRDDALLYMYLYQRGTSITVEEEQVDALIAELKTFKAQRRRERRAAQRKAQAEQRRSMKRCFSSRQEL